MKGLMKMSNKNDAIGDVLQAIFGDAIKLVEKAEEDCKDCEDRFACPAWSEKQIQDKKELEFENLTPVEQDAAFKMINNEATVRAIGEFAKALNGAVKSFENGGYSEEQATNVITAVVKDVMTLAGCRVEF